MPVSLISVIAALIVVGAVAWLANAYIPLESGTRRIVNVVMALIVVGILLWIINVYIPMAESIKTILNIVVVAATCVKVLQAVGLWREVVRVWNDLTHRPALR